MPCPTIGGRISHIVPYIQGGITTGWPKSVKQGILVRQRYICPICGRTLNKPYIFHHIKNRCCGGGETVENGEARHVACEAWAHSVDKRGNPTLKQINEYRRTLYGRPQYEVSVGYPHWAG